jgi:hypothetical protein
MNTNDNLLTSLCFEYLRTGQPAIDFNLCIAEFGELSLTLELVPNPCKQRNFISVKKVGAYLASLPSA